MLNIFFILNYKTLVFGDLDKICAP